MKPSRYFLVTLLASVFASAAVSAVFLWLAADRALSLPFFAQRVEKTVQTVRLTELQGEVEGVARDVSPSVVSIVAAKDVQTWRADPLGFFFEPGATVRRDVGGGTGIFVTKSGAVLTNKHVVSDPDATYRVAVAGGREFDARVLAVDPTTDLALLQADVGAWEAPAAAFAPRAGQVRVGNFVVAIGNALAQFRNSVTLGIVSGLGRSIRATDADGRGGSQLAGLIQTDAAINPGNSGGPLVGLDGKVLGINTAVAGSAQGIGFSIPVSQPDVDYLVTSVAKFGKIRRSYLGVRYSSLDADLAARLKLSVAQGDLVLDDADAVLPGSPAQKAGLTSGDVITAVDGARLSSDWTIKEALSAREPGTKVTLEVVRDGKVLGVPVELGER